MTKVDWTDVTLQMASFKAILSQYPTLEPASFLELQPRYQSACQQFMLPKTISKILRICGPDNTLYRSLIQADLQRKTGENIAVVHTETRDLTALFPRIDTQGKVTPGLLDKANHGYLIISAQSLMMCPALWINLKSALQGCDTCPIPWDTKQVMSDVVTFSYDIKLVIVGDLEQWSELEYFDSDLSSGLTLFTELETELKITSQSLTQYLCYLKWLVSEFGYQSLTLDGIEQMCTYGTRETEDQQYLPLGLLWHQRLLSIASQQTEQINKATIQSVYHQINDVASYLPQRAINDILDGQVIIETDGERIGQINGLTVIDVAGHPLPYGEPARISCVIHFGDGDVSDVERKAELGGNLHAKGMMIMQAFLSSALKLEEPLPFSASIVFEQSYSEVDGDSASLAELCSLVSALSETPLKQSIAVTGAVDQFGRVQAVGGLNDKIEGFYRVCCHRGLSGEQGVILPKSNVKHLTLSDDIIDSMKNDEFHIWAVDHVDQAIPLLMGQPFRTGESHILEKIAQKIDTFARHEPPKTLWQQFKNKLIRY
ncbi:MULTISPECIES: Lon protease family protein [unclassified Vibrio]|uniref:endopeptidase La n=1 Tax=Vibrio sp. HB236076 TaxID=3232307 RepID=A0AB39H7I8_9VIBR|nr:Lon protease family protein [Vibrio sp. HB161653]MDP5253400.1 Lon protease family protein [Vibrio sp. HB161653]